MGLTCNLLVFQLQFVDFKYRASWYTSHTSKYLFRYLGCNKFRYCMFCYFLVRTCFNEILVWTRSISCCYSISYMFINNSIFCVLHEFHRIVIHVFIFQTVFFDSSFVGISLFLNNNTHVWTFRHYMSKTKNM